MRNSVLAKIGKEMFKDWWSKNDVNKKLSLFMRERSRHLLLSGEVVVEETRDGPRVLDGLEKEKAIALINKKSPCGGTGRHRSLKSCRHKRHEGSNPSMDRTKKGENLIQ